ncbi:MAG TPA: MMPL family transporter [Nocardioides sp.]|uniref:MMPL family transporter n=1 Tax=Nocardioides sp. TaxID=35761 RepID=UPI002F417C50
MTELTTPRDPLRPERDPASHLSRRGVLTALGHFVVNRARLVLVGATVAVLCFGLAGAGAFAKLKAGGFEDPGAASTTARTLLDQRLGGASTVVLLVHAKEGTVDDASARRAAMDARDRLSAIGGVTDVTSYWSTHDPQLRSADHRYALIVGSTNSDHDLTAAQVSSLRSDSASVEVSVGGDGAISNDVITQVLKSLRSSEAIAVPIVLVLLMFVFGSAVAAGLPLVIGLISILGTFAELFVLGSMTDVAIFAINMTTALGMALGIDYALLMVSRFREELARGQGTKAAVMAGVQSAGRTIVFSGATVVAALAVLLVFPMYFLRSFAYAGIGVVLISVAAALVVLPALLVVLGPRVNAGRLPWMRGRAPSSAAPFWGRLAGRVMRRPVLFALPVLAALVLLAVPVRHLQVGTPDDRVLPDATPSRVVGDTLRSDFAGDTSTAIDVVAAGALEGAPLAAYGARLSALPGVVRAESSVGTFVHGHLVPNTQNPALAAPTAQRVTVVSSADPRSASAKALVRTVRGLPQPAGAHVYVGGQTAELLDTTHAIDSRLPFAALWVLLTTFAVLFLFSGSVLQPVRSLLLNALTLTATAGLLVVIFQEGHLSGLLHFTPLPLDTSMLVLLFCIAFGLSMDYEVIVLSRIKELHDAGYDDTAAVTGGLTTSGRIVTMAAALMAVTFFANASATVSFIQLFGIGTGFAVLVDATLVRAVLVPAAQRLLGRAAWYAPAFLRRLPRQTGLAESATGTL